MKFDQEMYEALLIAAKQEDVHIVHNFDRWYPWGGFTATWQRTNESAKCKMIRVSISYCSKKDQFCRRTGAFNALSNWNSGNTIMVPIGCEDSEYIVRALRCMFGYPLD